MKKIIVNADDFGLTKNVSNGIVEAWKNGIVTSTTMMMNLGESTDYAIELAKKYPDLPIGVHLNIRMGKPLTEGLTNIVDENGDLYKQNLQDLAGYDLNEVEQEYRAQIKKFYAAGLVPTHIDSHHHSHGVPGIDDVTLKIAKEFDLPIRPLFTEGKAAAAGIQSPDTMIGDFYQEGVSVQGLIDSINELPDDIVVDIMTHPAVVDDELRSISSYSDYRTKEVEVLTDPELMDFINENNIQLTSYRMYR
ncbi:chitin disaccharide deacetylase [Culicoidibacter larvae]|uniref:Carbohydrate deacetylase n=1 Tax=Culicoidibacter larvae TaxID=2579976 RepID=A0A5R8QH54_9FIRM|nr:chitin disaccharide deacetylase [Culicoidibacter larvae]TLG77076.1 chitin disaccharide deacetylase [Culicoidibacter larvae]